MDKGAWENKAMTTEEIWSYDTIRNQYVSSEAMARLKATELRKDKNLESLLHLLRLHYELNRHALEWTKAEMDRRAGQVTEMASMFNDWMEKWGSMLEAIKKGNSFREELEVLDRIDEQLARMARILAATSGTRRNGPVILNREQLSEWLRGETTYPKPIAYPTKLTAKKPDEDLTEPLSVMHL